AAGAGGAPNGRAGAGPRGGTRWRPRLRRPVRAVSAQPECIASVRGGGRFGPPATGWRVDSAMPGGTLPVFRPHRPMFGHTIERVRCARTPTPERNTHEVAEEPVADPRVARRADCHRRRRGLVPAAREAELVRR